MSDAFQLHIRQATGGYYPQDLPAGKFVRFPTTERRGDTSGYAKRFEDGRGGIYGDFRTGLKGTWWAADTWLDSPAELAQRKREAARAEQQRQVLLQEAWSDHAEENAAIWSEADLIGLDDPVGRYLVVERRLSLPSFPPSLRYHASLECWDGRRMKEYPTMLAPIRNVNGDLISLHRTRLTVEGKKAPVNPVRAYTPTAGPLAGCAVYLPGRKKMASLETIGVAEGIETALACTLSSKVWTAAATNAHMLKTFRWFPATRELIIFADNDKNGVGQAAGEALAKRAKAAGLSVKLLVPEQEGWDWADVYVASRTKEAA